MHTAPGCPMLVFSDNDVDSFFSLAGFTLGHSDHAGAPNRESG